MAKERKKHEGDQRGGLPDKIDFKGLIRDEAPGRPTGRTPCEFLLRKATRNPSVLAGDEAI
jgi:hypothetical protein